MLKPVVYHNRVQFRRLLHFGILGKIYHLDFVVNLKRRKQPDLAGARVLPLGVPVPVVPGHPHQIALAHVNFVVVLRVVRQHHLPVVRVLAAVVVDVVQRFEPAGRVRVQRLHDLVRHAAHLRAERTHEVVAQRQQMDVQDDAVQGRVGVAR